MPNIPPYGINLIGFGCSHEAAPERLKQITKENFRQEARRKGEAEMKAALLELTRKYKEGLLPERVYFQQYLDTQYFHQGKIEQALKKLQR